MATVKDLPRWRDGAKVTFTQQDGGTLEAEIVLRPGNDEGLDKATTVAEPYATTNDGMYAVRLIHLDWWGAAAKGNDGLYYGTVRNVEDDNMIGLWDSTQATIVANGIGLVQALA